jgi:Putative Flp pilus-assembly TadE/G-like
MSSRPSRLISSDPRITELSDVVTVPEELSDDMNMPEELSKVVTTPAEEKSWRESGQVLIFSALMMLFVAVPIMGLAIEGGRIFVSYRQIQSAADLAALGGALKLNTSAQAAISQACTLSQSNGFGGGPQVSGNCLSAGNVQVSACAPPQTQSPYSAVDYKSSTNTSCANTVGKPSYLEVRITDTIGTIPIFNIPVTLFAHAVARPGTPGVPDYAIAALDPDTTSATIAIATSNGIIAVGAITDNSQSPTSIHTGGSGTNPYLTCGTGWFNTSSEANSVIPQIGSNSTGQLQYAPPSCTGGALDSPTQYQPNAGAIADPYGSSTLPDGNMGTNCPQCSNTITHYWERATSTWQTIGSQGIKVNAGNVVELYPGVYDNGGAFNGGTVYFNPGVYTWRQGVTITGSTMCVYGAPVCGEQTTGIIPGTTSGCASASFSSSDPAYVAPGIWNYNCSPYGVYDTNHHGATNAAEPDITFTPPTFLDTSVTPAVPSSLKLNGVTFYMGCLGKPAVPQTCQKAKDDFSVTGNAIISLAAPNSCTGNGNGSGSSVDFPNGANYNRVDTVPAAADGSEPAINNSGGVQMYPNVNFLKAGDATCTSHALVWNGEMGSTVFQQHLHFLLFSKNDNVATGNPVGSGFSLAGGGQQNFVGILHTFDTYADYPNPPCWAAAACGTGSTADDCPGCSVTATGGSGGSNGPPFLSGQIIADNVTIGGSALIEVFNRPGGAPSSPGSSLVQ